MEWGGTGLGQDMLTGDRKEGKRQAVAVEAGEAVGCGQETMPSHLYLPALSLPASSSPTLCLFVLPGLEAHHAAGRLPACHACACDLSSGR